MPFRHGSVSYARFAVVGGPTQVDQDLVDALAAGQLTPAPVGAVELETGWVAGRHVLDTDFERESIVFGDTLVFGLRIDTNRVPADLRRAYRALAEQARRAESVTGAISKVERRDAKEEAEERCRAELSSGRHRKSKLVPVVWDVARKVLLAPAFGDAPRNALEDLFRATIDGATLEPRSAGGLAGAILGARGRSRDYEDVRPSPFTNPPAGASGDEGRAVSVPAVPWSWAGPEPKDFLGNEFLLWLWFHTLNGAATIDTHAGPVAVVFDRLLETQCAWDVTGAQSLRADGPTRLPEAMKALSIGKWPRKAGLLVAAGGEHWEFSFQADRFNITSAKLPKPDEPISDEREMVEYRLASLESLDRTMVSLFTMFLDLRMSEAWMSTRASITGWIRGDASSSSAPAPAPAPEIVTTIAGNAVPEPV